MLDSIYKFIKPILSSITIGDILLFISLILLVIQLVKLKKNF